MGNGTIEQIEGFRMTYSQEWTPNKYVSDGAITMTMFLDDGDMIFKEARYSVLDLSNHDKAMKSIREDRIQMMKNFIKAYECYYSETSECE